VVLPDHGDLVTSAALSPDGRQVITASKDGARVGPSDGSAPPEKLTLSRVDETGQPLSLLGVLGAGYSPDGSRLVTTSSDDAARVWRTDRTSDPVELRHDAAVSSASFSPDGEWVVTVSKDETARVWRADRASDPVELRHDASVSSASFSPDGERVVTASDDETARVWRTDGAGEPIVLRHNGQVYSASFSPDGGQVVTTLRTSPDDREIWVLSADGTGEPLKLGNEDMRWRSAAFTRGRALILGTFPSGVHVVSLNPEDYVAYLWRSTPYCLPQERRTIYLGETDEQAREHAASCREIVAQYAAHGAYRRV